MCFTRLCRACVFQRESMCACSGQLHSGPQGKLSVTVSSSERNAEASHAAATHRYNKIFKFSLIDRGSKQQKMRAKTCDCGRPSTESVESVMPQIITLSQTVTIQRFLDIYTNRRNASESRKRQMQEKPEMFVCGINSLG